MDLSHISRYRFERSRSDRPRGRPAVAGLGTLLLLLAGGGSAGWAFDWVPTDDEIAKYRRSWNPPTHGPTFTVSADLVRPGQWLLWAYTQGMIGSGKFENNLSSRATAAPFSPDSVNPIATLYYGLNQHAAAGIAVSGIYWHSNHTDPDGRKSGSGIGTTSFFFKYRPVVQDPDTWRPSISLYSKLSLPTNRWAGTPEIPGGFTPLSRTPSSRFGAIAFSEGVLFRKNLEPFRISGGIFYTYNAPGSEHGQTAYGGDLINTRLALEHVLNEKQGFGYFLELATLHQTSFRLDGHRVNTTPATFSLLGVQPGIEYTFFRNDSGARLVGATGVMFTVAGQNDVRAIYPNISFKYFFDQP